MILQMFSIYDRVSKAFGAPVFSRTASEIGRSLTYQMAVGEMDPMMLRYPEDFELVRIGSFDTDSGIVGNFGDADDIKPVPEFVARLSSFKEQAPNAKPNAKKEVVADA